MKLTKYTQFNIRWSRAAILVSTLVLSILNAAVVNAQTRKFVDPGNEYAKLVGIVTQLDGTGGISNGFVIGPGGCHLITTVHSVYGINKDSRGNAILVDDVSVGRKVRFQVDWDSKVQKFKRAVEAQVVEFGNFVPDTRRGRTQDIAVLKLDACLGTQYGIIAFDHEAIKKRFPSGELLTIGFGAINGEVGIVEEECTAFPGTPITGLMLTNCYTEPVSSGMMYLEKSRIDGKRRLVGVHQGRETLADGTNVPVAVYARAFNPILDRALGKDSPFSIHSGADNRATK